MTDDYTKPATGPLKGVKVIDLTINVLGPLCTQILGDMGAEVIKVEPPGGDPMRKLGPGHEHAMAAHFMAMNRNKRSLELDLKRPAAASALKSLIGTADVLVHSMRTAAAERLGLDYAGLSASNPRLIYAAAGGYAQSGPWKDRPAYDDVIQGQSGLAGMIEQANGEARYAPMAIADKFCGTQLASHIGMALFARSNTGQGQMVHMPMLETMTAFNVVDHLWLANFDRADEGVGFPRMFTPHRRPYPTQDGHISLLAITNAQWRRLFAALGKPELADDERFAELEGRTVNIDALYSILGARIAEESTAYWQAAFDAADIANAPMASLESLFEDPYLRETGFFQLMAHPDIGPTLQMRPPPDFSDTPANIHRPQPLLNADGRAVLEAAGLDETAIAAAFGS
jgi:crotonobetainyl-CoA:carnitine CoA-transferase CaiB-like acyl-CoA transferase